MQNLQPQLILFAQHGMTDTNQGIGLLAHGLAGPECYVVVPALGYVKTLFQIEPLIQAVERAADQALRRYPDIPVRVIATSLGGVLWVEVLARHPEWWSRIESLVLLGAPLGGAHFARMVDPFGWGIGIAQHLSQNRRQLAERLTAVIATLVVAGNTTGGSDGAGQKLFARFAPLEGLQATVQQHPAQADRLAKLKRALLVLHAPTDTIVGIENAGQIFTAAKHPKSFVSLDGADHLLTQPGPAAYAAAMIAAWVEPYLAPPLAADAPDEGHVRVTSTEAKFTSIVDSSGHSFLADEPLKVGGVDLGPTPYDLLLSGLGSCTAMTIKLVADREGMPLTGVTVDLHHARCHSADCAETGANATGAKPKIEVIERAITLTGDLSEAQRARLLVIADKCPVHRTLESHPVIKTRLV